MLDQSKSIFGSTNRLDINK
uniref:Uncharacterized protein n=1 Tax=Arundo donax TaxID=35708 RepID=A0A0A8XXK1_ARUDO